MNLPLLYMVCGLLIVLIIYKQRKCWYFIWQLNGWRGIFQQPILWLLLIIYLEPKSIMVTIQRCHKYFQFPLAIIVFNRILLYVDDPETMECILTAPECLNKTFLQNGFYANKGLLHAKDEQWKIRRKQLNPAFSQATLAGFFKVFNRIANELRLKVAKDLPEDSKMEFKNFEDLITRTVLQVSCLTTMGYETHFLNNDDQGIARTYRFLMELTALRILKPWYQIDFIFRLLDNENYEKSKNANKLVTQFVANIVQQKHFKWQQQQQEQLKKSNITTNAMKNKSNKDDDDDASVVSATNRPMDAITLNEQDNNHNFAGTTAIAAAALTANDALQNVNAFMEQQLPTLQHQQRIFIDQMLYLAQKGKLTLEDIMNETQSMVVVSFETVSSCIINALLCLAINRECQMKLRNEIKHILCLSKDTIKSKDNITTTTTAAAAAASTSSIKHNNNTKSNNSNNKTTTTFTNATVDSDWDSKMTANIEVDDESDGDCDDDGDIDVNNCDGNTCTHDGTDDKDNDEYVPVTMEHLLNMPYLDMIINESLRLLTTVPMNLRSVSADFQLNLTQPKRDKCDYISITTSTRNNCNSNNKNSRNNSRNGDNCHRRCIVVPKDTMIALDIFNMQRNVMYWGKNALNFCPEHFATQKYEQQRVDGKSIKTGENPKEEDIKVPTSAFASRHPYAFIPFSKGLRTCIGYRYSIYLSKIILIKLISSFDFSTNIQLKDLQCYEGVSLKFRNAEHIHFQIQPVD